MKLAKGHLRKLNKSIMLLGISNSPHGFKLMEGNIHN